MQLSSAAAERVFSLLSETLGGKNKQNNPLEDYIESCSIMTANVFVLAYVLGQIWAHNFGHNRAKIVAVLNSIIMAESAGDSA